MTLGKGLSVGLGISVGSTTGVCGRLVAVAIAVAVGVLLARATNLAAAQTHKERKKNYANQDKHEARA